VKGEWKPNNPKKAAERGSLKTRKNGEAASLAWVQGKVRALLGGVKARYVTGVRGNPRG